MITDKQSLEKIDKFVQQGKSDNSINHIDVRTKIILNYSDNSSATICFDKFNHAEYSGSFVTLDESFFKLIRENIK